MKKLLVTTALIVPLLVGGTAMAGPLFVNGSSFTVSGTNTPGDILGTNNATITDGLPQQLLVAVPGTVLGHLLLTVNEVPVAGGGEWITFSYSESPLPLVGLTNQNWNINETGLLTNQATNFVSSFISFDNNGANLAPTSCNQFGNFHVAAAPVSGGSGTGCLATGFSIPELAGPLGSLGTTIDPFSFISASGINPNLVTSYFQALEFLPQNGGGAVPEPGTLFLIGTGMLGLMWARKWR